MYEKRKIRDLLNLTDVRIGILYQTLGKPVDIQTFRQVRKFIDTTSFSILMNCDGTNGWSQLTEKINILEDLLNRSVITV